MASNASDFDRESLAYQRIEVAKRAYAAAEDELIKAQRDLRDILQGGAYGRALNGGDQNTAVRIIPESNQ